MAVAKKPGKRSKIISVEINGEKVDIGVYTYGVFRGMTLRNRIPVEYSKN